MAHMEHDGLVKQNEILEIVSAKVRTIFAMLFSAIHSKDPLK